ncbi:hypothetical protein V1498_12540 [Peribacillus sp. SCS-26]|uniref:hypothetical protein n=1 Tax=Paraperibacillus marinus TaxID=3115295 RepID=UPI0039064508
MDLLKDKEYLKSLFAGDSVKRLAGLEALLNRTRPESNTDGKSRKYIQQADKDETLITLFALSTLQKIGASAWEDLMDNAFPGKARDPIINHCLKLEKAISPSREILDLLQIKAQTNPVKYIREDIKENKPVEGKTTFDAVLKLNGAIKVYIECKFTSDISCQTTYVTTRNQLARCIEVGLADAKYDLDQFYFLLITPEIFKKPPGSRLYYYKMKEYMSDPEALLNDIGTINKRPEHSHEKKWLQELNSRIGWVTWEECLRIIEKSKNNFPEYDLIENFFRERMLSQL